MRLLISHPDPVISRYVGLYGDSIIRNALIACSKLMLNHWEYMNFVSN